MTNKQPFYHKLLNRLSISRKLLSVMMIASCFAMLVTSATFVAYQYLSFKDWLAEDLTSDAAVMAHNSMGALAFNDPLDGQDALEAIQGVSSMTGAALYDKNGRLFASWQKANEPVLPVPAPNWTGIREIRGQMLIAEKIYKKEQFLGTIILRSNQQELAAFLQKSMIAIVFLMVLTSAITLLLSNWLKQIISGPVAHLSTVMARVAKDKDYSIRGERQTEDELGRLTDYFNTMLGQIEVRDKELSQLRNYLTNVIESMPSALIGLDVECRVTRWNMEAERISGLSSEQAIGCRLQDVLPQFTAQLAQVKQAIRDRQVHTASKIQCPVEGVNRFNDITIYPLVTNEIEGAVLRVDDVTERIQIEEMMVQTEKMMSVGGLAAGMAHEINNPLGIMIQAVQNIERRVSPEFNANVKIAEECGTSVDKIHDYLQKRMVLTMINDIREAGTRAAKIVANMLSFSRRSESSLQYAAISELIDQTIELAANDYDLKKKYDFRHIDIIKEYGSDIPQVKLVITEFEQVILNLLKNAAQAMAGSDMNGRKPTITIRVSRDNNSALVEIEDNGPGMEENVRKRIFEPFFTTKPPGSGTGLGLSVSYMIINNNHNGSMEVKSRPGAGARFIIRLPIVTHN